MKDKVWKTHQNNSKLTNILTFNIKTVINRETILFGHREVFETFNKNSTLVIILITHSKFGTAQRAAHVAQARANGPASARRASELPAVGDTPLSTCTATNSQRPPTQSLGATKRCLFLAQQQVLRTSTKAHGTD